MGKIKLLYIFGTDRSGSTLLDMVLGSNDGFFSVGEIHYFDDFMHDLSQCSCHRPASKCTFWSQVLESLQNNRWRSDLASHLTWKKRLKINLMRTFLPVSFTKKKSLNFAETNKTLYEEILRISGSTYIVESSKVATRAYLLYLSGYFDIYPIYITRKIEDYLISIRKPQTVIKNTKMIGPKKGILKWISRTCESMLFIKKIRKDYVHITYDRLALNPSVVIKKIGKFYKLPLKYDSRMVKNTNYHIIGGNSMKFREFNGIFYDKKKGSEQYQSTITKLLNDKFVFSNI